MAFHGVDYYALDELLSDEERLVRDTFRRFVDAEVMPSIAKHFRAGTFPLRPGEEAGRAWARWGRTSRATAARASAPSPTGSSCRSSSAATRACARSPRCRARCACTPIHDVRLRGAEAERWLPGMARGEAIGCFGLTEPDFGSNPAGMLCTAAKQPRDGYRLNGDQALDHQRQHRRRRDRVGQAGRQDARLPGREGHAGLHSHDIEGKFSLRASVTSELILEDVEVPEDAMLPGASGIKGPLNMPVEPGALRDLVGRDRRGHGLLRRGARLRQGSRKQFSRPIAGYQLVQAKLAEMVTEITKAQLVAWRLGTPEGSRARCGRQQVSLAKRNNVYMALEIARTARDILGANGITDEYQCGRHMCNLESVYTYEGTHDIHTLILGQDVTGIAAFE